MNKVELYQQYAPVIIDLPSFEEMETRRQLGEPIASIVGEAEADINESLARCAIATYGSKQYELEPPKSPVILEEMGVITEGIMKAVRRGDRDKYLGLLEDLASLAAWGHAAALRQ